MSIETQQHKHEPKIGRLYQYSNNQGGYTVHYGHVSITVLRGPLFKKRLAFAIHRSHRRHDRQCGRHRRREQAKHRVLGTEE